MPRSIDGGLIAGAPLFAGLEPAALREIAKAAHLISRRAGDAFFAQDDPADAFFVLTEGRVRITQVTADGHQVTVRYIGPGEMFGTVPLFAGGPYPATALAVLDSAAARWARAAVGHLTTLYPAILANALGIVGRRLQEMQDRYRELATERVERRIARAILHLSQARRGHPTPAGIDFPVSRQDIAELTGATLHTVSRILSTWEQNGILHDARMQIRIARLDGLRAIAEEPTEKSGHGF